VELAGKGARGQSHFELGPPGPVEIVEATEVERQIQIAPDAVDRIEKLVAAFVTAIVSLDVHGNEYARAVSDMNRIGEREFVATSQMSGHLLDRPLRAMSGTLEGNSPIARSLAELRETVEDLNPARYNLDGRGTRRLLRLIRRGNRVRAYFERYGRADGHIQRVVRALSEARAELQRDNAVIAQEQRSLWTEMETLRQYAYMAQRLDEAVEDRIPGMAVTDDARAGALRDDVLFPVRQRRADILTQLAIATQGFAALRVVEENNHQVIRAIEMATTTTIAALRTAVMVAQALTNQRLLMDQLEAVNAATSEMLDSTPTRPRGGSPRAGAASPSGLDLSALQRAWDDVFAALDQIDSYKTSALEAMTATVGQLNRQIERSRDSVGSLQAPSGAASVPQASPSSPSSQLTIR
jgi:uncharacterized protein YaaN involved in tellurite resistance